MEERHTTAVRAPHVDLGKLPAAHQTERAQEKVVGLHRLFLLPSCGSSKEPVAITWSEEGGFS